MSFWRRLPLLRRFLVVNTVVVVGGAVLAFYADRPPDPSKLNYASAARELGGALVSGGVIAALVLWFEERREDERIDREEARDDAAAARAWRREIDIRLIALVFTDLLDGRSRWRGMVDSRAASLASRSKSADSILRPGAFAGSGPVADRKFSDITGEVETLLDFLRDAHLTSTWERWDEAVLANQDAILEPGGDLDDPLATNQALSKLEHHAWMDFLDSVRAYRDTNYPA